jgi:hypothetical protein
LAAATVPAPTTTHFRPARFTSIGKNAALRLVDVNFSAISMQLQSNSHTQSPLVVTRITAKATTRRVQSMVIDFLRGQENRAVWPACNRSYSVALRPALLTEQFLDFDVERR